MEKWDDRNMTDSSCTGALEMKCWHGGRVDEGSDWQTCL